MQSANWENFFFSPFILFFEDKDRDLFAAGW